MDCCVEHWRQSSWPSGGKNSFSRRQGALTGEEGIQMLYLIEINNIKSHT